VKRCGANSNVARDKRIKFVAVLRITRFRSLAPLLVVMACHRSKPSAAAVEQAAHPLAVFAAQRIVLAPTARARGTDTSALFRDMGSARMVRTLVDGRVIAQLRDRGLDTKWVLPADLQRTYERNRTYASDPYDLAVEPLRSPKFEAGSKYGEPLSSQLRTMIAFHDDARLVLLPVEFRYDGTRAILRAALLDARTTEARWVGEIRSDPAPSSGAFAMTQVANRLIDLFAAP
jgi:hypothetical protein